MPFVVRLPRPAAVLFSAAVRVLKGLLVASFFLSGLAAAAQNAAPGPNSDPTYQALRNLTLSGEAVTVSNFELKRVPEPSTSTPGQSALWLR